MTSVAPFIGICVAGMYISGVRSCRSETVFHIADDTDDLAHDGFARIDRPAGRDAFPDRVLPGKEFVGETLVDDA